MSIRALNDGRKQGAFIVNVWSCLGALVLSFGWLLPIHRMPWTTFHSDAWVAGVLLLVALISLFKTTAHLRLSYLMLLAACLCLVPLLQLATGQIKLAGTAWVGFLYMLGFWQAMLTGALWEQEQRTKLADMLFSALGIAATVSVALQLCQWLNVSGGCLCAEGLVFLNTENRRASASMAQPNQLATLLVWGVLAYAWAYVRCAIRGPVAVAAILFLVLGIAMTESRTGALALGILVIGVWYWKHLWPYRRAPLVVAILFICYVVIAISLVPLSSALLSDYTASWLERTVSETRFKIWLTFASAALHQPLLGYGLNQSLLSQATPDTLMHTPLELYRFLGSYAHNLFLDLVIWLGLPLGSMVGIALLNWVLRTIRNVKSHQDALLAMAVIAIGTHAMFEFPLYYAYFLLPLGLMIGMIDVGLPQPRPITIGLPIVFGLWLVSGALFSITLRDYFLVEDRYSQLRLEEARISGQIQRPPPEVLILTQLRDFIILVRLEPLPDISIEQTEWIKNVALAFPSSQNLLKLATALAFRNDATEARMWLIRLCAISTTAQCADAEVAWGKLQLRHAELRHVLWPVAKLKLD